MRLAFECCLCNTPLAERRNVKGTFNAAARSSKGVPCERRSFLCQRWSAKTANQNQPHLLLAPMYLTQTLDSNLGSLLGCLGLREPHTHTCLPFHHHRRLHPIKNHFSLELRRTLIVVLIEFVERNYTIGNELVLECLRSSVSQSPHATATSTTTAQHLCERIISIHKRDGCTYLI